MAAARSAAKKKNAREKAASNRKVLQGIKLSKGCLYCGYAKHPAALHFHHRNPEDKSFNVTQNCTFALERILQEAAKCDVVCANCHAELTHQWGG